MPSISWRMTSAMELATSNAKMLDELDDYYWQMAGRGRLILLDEGRVGLCTFFLLAHGRQEHRFYCRPTWSLPADDPQGTIVYIDKLILRVPMTRSIARSIEQAVAARYPQFTRALWYRPARGQEASQKPDRRYSYRRRVQ